MRLCLRLTHFGRIKMFDCALGYRPLYLKLPSSVSSELGPATVILIYSLLVSRPSHTQKKMCSFVAKKYLRYRFEQKGTTTFIYLLHS